MCAARWRENQSYGLRRKLDPPSFRSSAIVPRIEVKLLFVYGCVSVVCVYQLKILSDRLRNRQLAELALLNRNLGARHARNPYGVSRQEMRTGSPIAGQLETFSNDREKRKVVHEEVSRRRL